MASLIGQKLGKYHITRMIARGGMADVYRAKQDGLDRDVAVKVMHVYLAQADTFVTRFKREAASVAKMRHPHIIQLYDFDMSGDHYYMVMEYISGRTLEQLIREQCKLSLARVLEIAIPLADALEYAHGLGIIHRDIKPTNIMFTDTQCTYPILADFGINLTTGSVALTMEGGFVGTPGYMSPEASLHKQVDKRADIYSFGVVLYEMITGQPPFTADSVEALFASQLNDVMPDPRQIIPDLPVEFVELLQRCLAANPDDRYSSVKELKDAFESVLHAMLSTHIEPITDDPLRAALLGNFNTQALPLPQPTRTIAFEGEATPEAMQANATPAVVEAQINATPAMVDAQLQANIAVETPALIANHSWGRKVRLAAAATMSVTFLLLTGNSLIVDSVSGKEPVVIAATSTTINSGTEWVVPEWDAMADGTLEVKPISVSIVQATEVVASVPTSLPTSMPISIPTIEPSLIPPTAEVNYEPVRLLVGDNVLRHISGGQALHEYMLDSSATDTLLLTLSSEQLNADLTLELTNRKSGEVVALLRPAVTAVCIRISSGNDSYNLVVGARNITNDGDYNLRLTAAAQTQFDCPAPTSVATQ